MAVWKNLTFRSLCTLCKPIRSMLTRKWRLFFKILSKLLSYLGEVIASVMRLAFFADLLRVTTTRIFTSDSWRYINCCWHIRKIQTDNSTVIYGTVYSSQTTRTFWGYSRVQNLRDLSPCWKSVKPSFHLYSYQSQWYLLLASSTSFQVRHFLISPYFRVRFADLSNKREITVSVSYENSSLWNLCRGKEFRATKIMTPFGTLFE